MVLCEACVNEVLIGCKTIVVYTCVYAKYTTYSLYEDAHEQ